MDPLHTHVPSLPSQVRYGISLKKIDSLFTEDETRTPSTDINVEVERSLTTRARTRGMVSFSKGDFRSLTSSEK